MIDSTHLFKTKRFVPLFFSQFLGAFNDNLFKQSLTLWVIYGGAVLVGGEKESGFYTNLAAGIFILPFFLFSAIAGQLADKFDKSFILKCVKFSEIVIMFIALSGFYFQSLMVLFVALFLMGSHSAFFGPAKYSILPQLLKEDELMAGNGFLEMSTFIAILLGIITAGFLSHSVSYMMQGIFVVSLLGWMTSLKIPKTNPSTPHLKIGFNLWKETITLLSLAKKNRTVFLSILGISWLWFFGATLLAQLPNFNKFALNGNAELATTLVATFVVGIALGSVLSIKLSRGEIELGLVPFGAFGMTLFAADLFWIDYAQSSLQNTMTFLIHETSWTNWRIIFDLIMLGLMSSLYVVPLYALIQVRSDETIRSRIIAANNVLNAIFMVVSALLSMLFYQIGLNTIQIFLIVALLNLLIALYIFTIIPEFLMRFVIWLLAGTFYKLRFEGRENIPKKGAALIICNHVSFIDWFIVTSACQRPVRYVMDHRIFKVPILSTIFKLAKAIPIAPAREDAALKEKAFLDISKVLKEGHLVCIFPEGMITYDGTLQPFKPGLERILKTDPVPVIPIALKELWGSIFSRHPGGWFNKIKLKRRKISVKIDYPHPATITARELEAIVKKM